MVFEIDLSLFLTYSIFSLIKELLISFCFLIKIGTANLDSKNEFAKLISTFFKELFLLFYKDRTFSTRFTLSKNFGIFSFINLPFLKEVAKVLFNF
jgi:hypothetical protein